MTSEANPTSVELLENSHDCQTLGMNRATVDNSHCSDAVKDLTRDVDEMAMMSAPHSVPIADTFANGVTPSTLTFSVGSSAAPVSPPTGHQPVPLGASGTSDKSTGSQHNATPSNTAAAGGVDGPVAHTAADASTRNLYVSSLPNNFSTQQLYQMFCPFGTVLSARFMPPKGVVFGDAPPPMLDNKGQALPPDASHFRGFGFVCFEREEDAHRAMLSMIGTVIGGSKIQVRPSRRHSDGAHIATTGPSSRSSTSQNRGPSLTGSLQAGATPPYLATSGGSILNSSGGASMFPTMTGGPQLFQLSGSGSGLSFVPAHIPQQHSGGGMISHAVPTQYVSVPQMAPAGFGPATMFTTTTTSPQTFYQQQPQQLASLPPHYGSLGGNVSLSGSGQHHHQGSPAFYAIHPQQQDPQQQQQTIMLGGSGGMSYMTAGNAQTHHALPPFYAPMPQHATAYNSNAMFVVLPQPPMDSHQPQN
jgi:RNA recognition motif-containing protein